MCTNSGGGAIKGQKKFNVTERPVSNRLFQLQIDMLSIQLMHVINRQRELEQQLKKSKTSPS
ncbi:hypothetical protein [Bacillus solimangrovi]|uniref:Uncharacterized protein n=1 Tax=Bacillus solimangrovi TaxID=1305675 RepID=A0A1E5LDK7_9BACI|nr:hypothetical protein [Bacillus solimangrovi]OEH92171.1 hypothetical protein BFG57_02560 [Bacillus solimangrovi]